MKKLLAVSFFFLILQGCATLPEQSLIVDRRTVGDETLTSDESLAVIRGLTDNTQYRNLEGLEEVEVDPSSVKLVFKHQESTDVESHSYTRQRWYTYDEYGYYYPQEGEEETTTVSEQLNDVNTTHDFLLKDIHEIGFYDIQVYDNKLNGIDEYFETDVVLEGQEPFVVQCNSPLYGKRVAEAFSTLTQVPVTSWKSFPNQGVYLAKDSTVVSVLFQGSPLQQAGVGLLDRVQSVDTNIPQKREEILQTLKTLTVGNHFLVVNRKGDPKSIEQINFNITPEQEVQPSTVPVGED